MDKGVMVCISIGVALIFGFISQDDKENQVGITYCAAWISLIILLLLLWGK